MLRTPQDVRDFTLAGNAVLTLESRVTGHHYTYRVEQARDRDGHPQLRWFVSLLTGPDNTADYTYIGMLDSTGFRLTAKSRLAREAAPVAGFVYMWRWVSEAGRMPPKMEVRHEGRCGRCRRALTVPESLDRGIGPECAKHVAGAATLRVAA